VGTIPPPLVSLKKDAASLQLKQFIQFKFAIWLFSRWMLQRLLDVHAPLLAEKDRREAGQSVWKHKMKKRSTVGARGGRCKRLMEYFGSSSEAMEGIIVLIYLWWFLICNRVLNTKTK
jgi:hypothetical protein